MRSLIVAACTLAVLPLAAQAPRQTQEDDYTKYELLAPESAQFRIYYEVTATTPGARFFYNTIRRGSVATDERVVDLVQAPPALLLRLAERDLPAHQTHPDQAVERPPQRRRGASDPAGDLGDPVGAGADRVEQRPRFQRRRHLLDQQPVRLAVERAQGIEDERVDPRPQSAFETPAVLRAADVAPPELLRNDVLRIDDRVATDGLVTKTLFHSPLGEFEAEGPGMVAVRAGEIQALDVLSKTESSEIFQKAMAASMKR